MARFSENKRYSENTIEAISSGTFKVTVGDDKIFTASIDYHRGYWPVLGLWANMAKIMWISKEPWMDHSQSRAFAIKGLTNLLNNYVIPNLPYSRVQIIQFHRIRAEVVKSKKHNHISFRGSDYQVYFQTDHNYENMKLSISVTRRFTRPEYQESIKNAFAQLVALGRKLNAYWYEDRASSDVKSEFVVAPDRIDIKTKAGDRHTAYFEERPDTWPIMYTHREHGVQIAWLELPIPQGQQQRLLCSQVLAAALDYKHSDCTKTISWVHPDVRILGCYEYRISDRQGMLTLMNRTMPIARLNSDFTIREVLATRFGPMLNGHDVRPTLQTVIQYLIKDKT